MKIRDVHLAPGLGQQCSRPGCNIIKREVLMVGQKAYHPGCALLVYSGQKARVSMTGPDRNYRTAERVRYLAQHYQRRNHPARRNHAVS